MIGQIRKVKFKARGKDSFRFDLTLPKPLMVENGWDGGIVDISITDKIVITKKSGDSLREGRFTGQP
jgi:hypothetical protein